MEISLIFQVDFLWTKSPDALKSDTTKKIRNNHKKSDT